jgi:hypothetical protein
MMTTAVLGGTLAACRAETIDGDTRSDRSGCRTRGEVDDRRRAARRCSSQRRRRLRAASTRYAALRHATGHAHARRAGPESEGEPETRETDTHGRERGTGWLGVRGGREARTPQCCCIAGAGMCASPRGAERISTNHSGGCGTRECVQRIQAGGRRNARHGQEYEHKKGALRRPDACNNTASRDRARWLRTGGGSATHKNRRRRSRRTGDSDDAVTYRRAL